MLKFPNLIKVFFIFFMLLTSGFSLAQESANKTVADIKIEVISSMEKDGYLSEKMAAEVSQKYITDSDKQTVVNIITSQSAKSEQAKEEVNASQSVKWADYLSWISLFKVVGVIFFLIAFSGIIKRIILGLWVFIAAVPVIVYQSVFLVVGILGIIRPDLIWASQYFYVALFFSFANIFIVGWIIETHEVIQKIVSKLLNIGMSPSCVASFYGMIYFTALAFFYQSSIFGFFAAVCLSGTFSFGIYYMPGTLFLNFKDKMLPAVVFGHLFVIAAYTAIMKNNPEYTLYFNEGIQYYCTIALCVGLLVGASPFYKIESAIVYAAIFVVLFFVASYGFYIYDMKVVASIIFSFFILFVLEWVLYLGYQSGAIIGSAIIGGSLYGTAMLLEKYGSIIVLTMNK